MNIVSWIPNNINLILNKDMKKYIFTIAALVLGVSQMSAQRLVFGDIEVPKGGQTTYTVKYETGGESLTTASFTLSLPEGVSTEKNAAGKSKFTVDSKMAETFSAFTTDKDGFSVAATATGVSFPGTEGVLGTITLIADGESDLVIGQSYPVKVSTISLVKRNSETGALESVEYDDVTFNITIVENITVLDETSTTAPEAAENVDVKVLRTISATNWNTICLPFAMTGNQVKEAFGDGVKFANFTGYEIDDDGTELKVNFTSFDASAGLEANHPCLIQVENKVTEFKVLGVTIAPEDEPTIAAIPRTKKQWSEMIGTYVAETVLDETYLFISGNNFYYGNADGKTKMKAFRAYFDFYDELTNKTATAKVGFNVDGEATSIDGYAINRSVEGVYDLSGRKIKIEGNDLNKLQKGVYIIDGKKVTIK